MDGSLDDCWQQSAVLIASKKSRRCCVMMDDLLVWLVVVGLVWLVGWLVDGCLSLSSSSLSSFAVCRCRLLASVLQISAETLRICTKKGNLPAGRFRGWWHVACCLEEGF
jgi:hypothetical protein